MSVRFDPKGKYFTDVVSKLPLAVTIQTTEGVLHGTLHIHRQKRLLDELNEPPLFIAVTDVHMVKGDHTIKAGFISLHKDQIIWVLPDDERLEITDGE
jgi:hypothetical protein